jgi:hypothetical protein
MSAVDEDIVREYFEQNNFLVRQVHKYQVQSRKKTSDEEIDLLVYNPTFVNSGRKPDFFIFASELPYVHRAMVAVKAWHTGRLNPATIRSSPDILRFLEEQVQKEAHRLFAVETLEQDPNDEMLKLLVTPGLPTQEPYRSQSISLLQDKGVDGIISFRSMLLDLLDRVQINRNYGKSDTLQVMRILKNYDLLTDSQMGLFPGRETPTSRHR